MMDADRMVAAVEAYITSYNRADLDGVCAVFADDAVVEDPVGTPLKVGHAAIREFYTASMATGAKLNGCELRSCVVGCSPLSSCSATTR